MNGIIQSGWNPIHASFSYISYFFHFVNEFCGKVSTNITMSKQRLTGTSEGNHASHYLMFTKPKRFSRYNDAGRKHLKFTHLNIKEKNQKRRKIFFASHRYIENQLFYA